MSIIRWILAIPLAAAIGVGVLFLVFYVLSQLAIYGPSLWYAVFFGGGFLGGLVYMHVGCSVAPSHKVLMGWVLTALMTCTLAYFILDAMPQDLDTLLTGGVCASSAALVACLLTMLFKSIQSKEDQRSSSVL